MQQVNVVFFFLLFFVVFCCLLLFVVVFCCFLLFFVVFCCLLLFFVFCFLFFCCFFVVFLLFFCCFFVVFCYFLLFFVVVLCFFNLFCNWRKKYPNFSVWFDFLFHLNAILCTILFKNNRQKKRPKTHWKKAKKQKMCWVTQYFSVNRFEISQI